MAACAVLCPGPSLGKTWTAARPGVATIAVNAAITHQPGGVAADWWCCADFDAWPIFAGLPRIGCVGATRFPVGNRACPEGVEERNYLAIAGMFLRGHARCVWSTQVALVFAALALRAETIELHGCDLRGTADFAGNNDATRTDDRWRREAADLEATIGHLAAHGVATTWDRG